MYFVNGLRCNSVSWSNHRSSPFACAWNEYKFSVHYAVQVMPFKNMISTVLPKFLSLKIKMPKTILVSTRKEFIIDYELISFNGLRI